jgi:hypothetical protein
MTDADLARLLAATRVIALVGYSPNPDRPSHRVARFLRAQGYRVIPVNPGLAGQSHLGERVRARLSEIDPAEGVDMVDMFRRAEAVPPVVAEALTALPGLRTVWMQLGIRNAEARAAAEAAGVTVVEDRCPAIEIARLAVAPVA